MDGPRHRCPLAGKRSVELASGDFKKFIAALNDKQMLNLMPHCVDLSDSELATLIAEYKAGLGQLEAGVMQKLACWSALPWKLCGLGHADANTARAVAQWCIHSFDRFLHSTCKTVSLALTLERISCCNKTLIMVSCARLSHRKSQCARTIK